MKKVSKKGEDVNFQIEFYEGILRDKPDFVEALVALGEIYTKKGLYVRGLKVDRRLAQLKPKNPIIHYNLACSFSLLGDIANAILALKRAIRLGYDDFVFMNSDPDLANLRGDRRFRDLLKKKSKKRSGGVRDVSSSA